MFPIGIRVQIELAKKAGVITIIQSYNYFKYNIF